MVVSAPASISATIPQAKMVPARAPFVAAGTAEPRSLARGASSPTMPVRFRIGIHSIEFLSPRALPGRE